jgi:hypothetical protein
VADHQALQAPCERIQRRQAPQLQLDLFPFRQRVNEQAAVGAIHGCNQAPVGALDDALAITGRHGQPTFRIERHLVCTAEHAG